VCEDLYITHYLTPLRGALLAQRHYLQIVVHLLIHDSLCRIISWKVHGRAFAVHDRKRFVLHVLPVWFLQSRFESFQRQLNLYGFKRITIGPDRGSCYHQLFLRQKNFLAGRIQRLKLKGNGPRKPAAPDQEPNFYRMTFMPSQGDREQGPNHGGPPAFTSGRMQNQAARVSREYSASDPRIESTTMDSHHISLSYKANQESLTSLMTRPIQKQMAPDRSRHYYPFAPPVFHYSMSCSRPPPPPPPMPMAMPPLHYAMMYQSEHAPQFHRPTHHDPSGRPSYGYPREPRHQSVSAANGEKAAFVSSSPSASRLRATGMALEPLSLEGSTQDNDEDLDFDLMMSRLAGCD